MANLEKMSKKQLEAYARKELGVELDRRHSKKQLLAEVLDLVETQEVEEEVEVIKPPVTPKATSSSIDVRKHIEKISGERRDAATVWNVIKDSDHTDDDIRVIVKSLKFDTLLGEIS
jgi:hypothetical protein